MSSKIKIYDLENNKYFYEKVFGEWFLRWLYESGPGNALSFLFTKLPFSSIYGKYKSLAHSKKSIAEFIKTYDIKTEEFESSPNYQNFNDFFIRKFKDGERSFEDSEHTFPAFCEGRYLVYDSPEVTPIKKSIIDPLKLLNCDDGNKFKNAQVIICRLAPVDYHRFHFPDEGSMKRSYSIKGLLNSVTPFALKKKPDVLVTNKREVTILETKNFGTLAYVEVGAMTVGTIKQTYHQSEFKRGDEKGYFLFGGSTVVILTEKKVIDFEKKIIEESRNGIETFVKLGSSLGVKCNTQ